MGGDGAARRSRLALTQSVLLLLHALRCLVGLRVCFPRSHPLLCLPHRAVRLARSSWVLVTTTPPTCGPSALTPATRVPLFCATQVILGAGYDDAADMWSLACMVFELVTGERFPHGCEEVGLWAEQRQGDPGLHGV